MAKVRIMICWRRCMILPRSVPCVSSSVMMMTINGRANQRWNLRITLLSDFDMLSSVSSDRSITP
jgi:hypothetical protein